MNSIYTPNPRLDAIFNHVKERQRLVVVALDYAKSSHAVLFTNGLGDRLRAPFNVHNNREGCDFLIEAIKSTSKKRNIRPEHIIIVGEGFPSFARLFLANLQQSTKHELFQVHATDAKERRPSHLSSTDKSDLVGIAQCVLERRARSLHPLHTIPNYTTIPHQSPNQHPFLLRSYEELFADVQPLRELTRARHRLVQLQTKASNTIHALADQLLPGFLAKKSPICAFTKASLKMLESNFFSAEQIARKRPAVLHKYLSGCRTRDLKNSISQLIELARQANPGDATMRGTLQCLIKAQVALYRVYTEQVAKLDHEIEKRMIHSPASLLLSFGGIGMTLAAGIYAELGASFVLHPSRQLCAYAGVVPRSKQSGGPDKEAQQGKTPAGCNRILKNYLVQAANQIGQHGPKDLHETYHRLKANGQHADFAIARRLLRSFRFMMIHQTIYISPEHRNPSKEKCESLSAYYSEQWVKIAAKWNSLSHFSEACQPNNPLGFWAQIQQNVFEHLLHHPLALAYCPGMTEASEPAASA
jgi:transposase